MSSLKFWIREKEERRKAGTPTSLLVSCPGSVRVRYSQQNNEFRNKVHLKIFGLGPSGAASPRLHAGKSETCAWTMRQPSRKSNPDLALSAAHRVLEPAFQIAQIPSVMLAKSRPKLTMSSRLTLRPDSLPGGLCGRLPTPRDRRDSRLRQSASPEGRPKTLPPVFPHRLSQALVHRADRAPATRPDFRVIDGHANGKQLPSRKNLFAEMRR